MRALVTHPRLIVATSRFGLALANIAICVACGRTPPSPSPITNISLNSSSDVVLVGEAVQITAVNSETSQPIAVALVNRTPLIATLNGNVLTGVENGSAVVGAMGSNATLSVRVIANFNGWYPGRKANGDSEIGSAYAVECVEISPSYCNSNVLEERLGKGPEPFAMQISQTRDAVTGLVYIRCGNATVTGSVDLTGHLSLRGAFGLKGPPQCPIEEWNTYLVENGRALYGRFKYSSRANNNTSGGVVTFELRGVQRSP